MRIGGFLCIGNNEVINEVRTHRYFERGVVPWGGSQCGCPALDDGFDTPATDPAPWYDANHPESGEFGGLLADTIDLSPVVSRQVSQRLDEGSALGPEVIGSRIIEVSGAIFAASQQGMWWGEQWLKTVLRGGRCSGGCTGDEVSILPFCRDTGGPQSDYDGDFRTLFGCGLVAGPTFEKFSEDTRTYEGQLVHFQIAASSPWLFGQPVRTADGTVVASGGEDAVLVTSEGWSQGDALVITVAAGAAAVESATVDMTFSLDGTCPEDRVATSVSYDIADLAPNSSLTIDAVHRQVRYHNPTAHRDEAGFRHVSWEGAFCWPVVPACSSMCIRVRNTSSASLAWTVDSRKREM